MYSSIARVLQARKARRSRTVKAMFVALTQMIDERDDSCQGRPAVVTFFQQNGFYDSKTTFENNIFILLRSSKGIIFKQNCHVSSVM